MDVQVETPAPVNTSTTTSSPTTQRWLGIWRIFAGNRKASLGLIAVGFFVLLAAFGPIIIPQDPHTFTTDLLQSPSASHWFGTTNFGEDVNTTSGYPAGCFPAQ